MEEEFIYPSDEELADYFVDDLFNAFMVEIKKYPVLPIETQKDLAKQYKSGDQSAKEKLTNHNLRLVAYVASAYKNRIKHLKIMDIIQEGCIGLLKAIDRYEPEKGAFSTYAIPWIRQAIMRAIDNQDEDIRKPVHISFKIRKYRHICNEADRNHTPLPDDVELMEILECSEDTLELIKKKALETVVSAQTKVGDEDDSELGDFIADTRNDFDDALEDLNDQELLVVIKNKLRPIEYYFLYNYEIDKNSDDATLEGLAKDFNLTRERVRQIKKKAYDKSGIYVKNKKIRHMEAERIKKSLEIPISKIDVRPYDVDNVVLYSIIKNDLSLLERSILGNMLFGEIKMDGDELAKHFGLLKRDFESLVKKITIKVAKVFEDKDAFEQEKMKIIRMYKTKLFMLIPNDEIKESLIKNVAKKGQEKPRNVDNNKPNNGKANINEIVSVNEKPSVEKEVINNKDIALKPEEQKRDVFEIVDIKNHDLLVVIKEKLSTLEYYIFFYLLTNKNDMESAINNLAKLFNLTKGKILSYKSKITKKVMKLLEKKDFLITEIQIISNKYKTDIQNIKIDPLDPNQIILISYVKSSLTDSENQMLKYMILSPTIEMSELDLNKMGLTKEEAQEIIDEINKKIEYLLSETDKYERFKKNMLVTYGTNIFNKSFDKYENELDYESLKKFNSLSFEEIVDLYGDSWNQLDVNSQNLLKRYFTIPENAIPVKEIWEQNFFLELENISSNDKEPHLSSSVLYDCYIENKDSFSEQAQLFLECFVFNMRDKSEYTGRKKRQVFAYYKSILLDKLERIYFNVYNILHAFGFTKEQWLRVLEKHEDKFSENRIIAMNMLYGIDGETMSISEIAEVFDVERNKMSDYLANIRQTAMALYTNRSHLRDINEDIYIPYVLNKAYSFTDVNRDILKMYLIQELSYVDIKTELKKQDIKLSQQQISNIVTDALRKIDFYRFGIKGIDSYRPNFIRRFIHENKDKLTAQEKKIIKQKYLEHMDNDELAKMFGVGKETITKKIIKFNSLINNFKIKDVILTEEDYLNEFNTYPLERVVDEKQMHMLSYYHGIKCKYNPEGKIMRISKMIKTLPEYITEDIPGLAKKVKRADDLIKLKKKKVYHNDLVYMPTDEVVKILDDPHLPISDKERFIICSIYGIKNHPQKTLDEVSKICGERIDSVRRRYQRAFVSIFKYQNGEIPPKIDYDYDLLPLMRYFSKYDRMLIEDYYKDGLCYEKIAKKYKITYNQVVTRFNRLHLTVFEMINYPKKEYFDFDFFEKAIKDPMLPYYGNLEEDIKIFNLRFANSQVLNIPAPEIVKKLNLDRDEESVNKTIHNLIMAVCRYKKGIRKEHTYTIEDVKDYYMRHKDEMTPRQEKLYLTYFRRHLKEDAHRNKELITKLILKDIIKERNPEFNEISELNHDEVVDLIKHRHFSSNVLNTLLNKIGETERIIMNGQELNHVYRLLSRLDKTVNLADKQSLMKAQ